MKRAEPSTMPQHVDVLITIPQLYREVRPTYRRGLFTRLIEMLGWQPKFDVHGAQIKITLAVEFPDGVVKLHTETIQGKTTSQYKRVIRITKAQALEPVSGKELARMVESALDALAMRNKRQGGLLP